MDDLIRFARAAAADVDLQAQIQASTTADQIVALAAARGYTFNTADLRD
ncbi:MAG: Nif11-like leader peptide family natural product precursor [Prochlorococcaceae cyanobacterium]